MLIVKFELIRVININEKLHLPIDQRKKHFYISRFQTIMSINITHTQIVTLWSDSLVHLISSSSNEVWLVFKVTFTDLLGKIPISPLLRDFCVKSTHVRLNEALRIQTIHHWLRIYNSVILHLELLHEINDYRVICRLLLVLLLLLILLLLVKLTIELANCLLLLLNQPILIFILLSEHISIFFELHES
jgi:hypothetical protein